MNKKINKFDYPHPLVKNLHAQKIYTPENLNEFLKQKPCFYDNNYVFSPSIKSHISPKLLRFSNSKIVPQQKFGILMQPFHSKQEVEFIPRNIMDLQHYKCKFCKAFLNSQSQSTSLFEIKCKICDKVQSLTPEVKNALESVPRCYDLGEEDMNQSLKTKEKNVCFVIQASEFNFNYKVYEVIESCLNSLASTLNYQGQQLKNQQVQTQDEQASQRSTIMIDDFQSSPSINYNVSFILFNDKNIFLINQQTNDVMVFNQSFLSENDNVTQSLISFDGFFKPISQISQDTFALVKEILYSSYLKNSSCLDVVAEFIHKYVDKFSTLQEKNNLNQNLSQTFNPNKRQVEFKFFVNSLRFTKNCDQEEEKIQKTGILQNISNKLSLNNKKGPKTQQNPQIIESPLKLCSNFEFFYLPQSSLSSIYVSQKEVIKKLNSNLYKMYPELAQDKCKRTADNFFNKLYYDLYQNLQTQKYFNVKINITTSQCLEVLAVGNQALGYNDFSSQFRKLHNSSQTGHKFNSYQVVLKCLEPNNTLPIDLKIKNKSSNFNNSKPKSSETTHFLQISFQYFQPFIDFENKPENKRFTRVFHTEVVSLDRAINIRERIYSSLSTYVDDQVLFYFYLRWIMIECHKTKTNHTILKKLYQKLETIADQFKDSYGQIDFHKQYVRIFLYAFMITNKAIINGINEEFYYERHQWIKNSMQSFSKYLYPKTYSVSKNKQTHSIDVKNVKSAPKNFRSDSILLLDNGKNIYMIIGEDNSVEDLKKIFGTCFIHEIQQMTELPQLQSNAQYRQVIDLVRQQHQSNFLPLKIMELFSPQFDSEISNYLYVKDNHQKFMKKLWDMESAHK